MKYCRVCLKNQKSPVLLTQEQKRNFFQITGIELDEMNEEFLCKKCLKLLVVSWKFRTQAIYADDWFQKQENSTKEELSFDEDHHEEEMSPKVKCEILLDEEFLVEAIPFQLEGDIKPQEENPFICDLCDARFSCYRKILNHIRMHRKELGRFCRFCDKVFPNRSKTSQHERYHIEKANRVSSTVCENCGKSFSNLRQLRMHARTHAESYKCTVPGCSDAFTQKRAFYSHFATKHGIKQPCVCADCGNTFSNHLTLKNHRRLFHNDGIKVSCPECPKKCLNQGQLDSHMAVKHRGERNHGCSVCSKTYGRSTHLKRHYRDSHYEVYLELVKTKRHWKI